MKKVSDKEFEQCVKDLLDGKKALKEILEELETSHRTFYNRIQLLSDTNLELYEEYIHRFPHKTKEITTIPIRTIMMEFLKDNANMADLAKKYGIYERTLRRKIAKLKYSENPEDRELWELCRIVAHNHSTAKEHKIEIITKIKQLPPVNEQLGQTDTEKRRQQLLQLEKEYETLCQTMNRTKAAETMGHRKDVMFKLLNELYGLQIEKSVTESEEFRKKYGVSTPNIPTEKTSHTPETGDVSQKDSKTPKDDEELEKE